MVNALILRVMWDTQLRWLLDSDRLRDLERAAAIAIAFPRLLTLEERCVLARRGEEVRDATLDLVDAVTTFSHHACGHALSRGIADLAATFLNNDVPFLCSLTQHTRGNMLTGTWYDRTKLALARLMLARGARVEDADPHTGRTPLHNAASWGALELVRYFLSEGANPRARDHAGHTPASLVPHHVETRHQLLRLLQRRSAAR